MKAKAKTADLKPADQKSALLLEALKNVSSELEKSRIQVIFERDAEGQNRAAENLAKMILKNYGYSINGSKIILEFDDNSGSFKFEILDATQLYKRYKALYNYDHKKEYFATVKYNTVLKPLYLMGFNGRPMFADCLKR